MKTKLLIDDQGTKLKDKKKVNNRNENPNKTKHINILLLYYQYYYKSSTFNNPAIITTLPLLPSITLTTLVSFPEGERIQSFPCFVACMYLPSIILSHSAFSSSPSPFQSPAVKATCLWSHFSKYFLFISSSSLALLIPISVSVVVGGGGPEWGFLANSAMAESCGTNTIGKVVVELNKGESEVSLK